MSDLRSSDREATAGHDARESESRFRELADNISQFAWTADRAGWIYWYNKRWYDYTGTTLEEMQGWGWQKVHHPEHVDRVVQRIRQSFETGTAWEDTFPLRGRDGSYRWFLSRALPIRDETGEVVRWFGTNTDITEQIDAEQALRDSETRFHELADNISQFAWTADRAGWIYWYNKRWYDYTGTTLEEMQGWGWQNVHHPEHVDRVVQRIRQSFETGTPWEDTFPLRGRDGSYRWFLSRALPIRDETGEVVRWLGTNTDVTRQIEAESALRELNDDLERRVEAETRERLRVWNVSQDLLVVADLDGTYLTVNPAWTAVLGWPESALVGKDSQWLLHPDDRERTRAETGRLAVGQKALHFESRYRHRNGSYRWLSWTAVPDRERIYGMARDITGLKEAEHKLDEAGRQLAQVTRRTTLATMTASIAHEINQPLGAIVLTGNACSRLLASSEPDLEAIRAALKRIVDDGRRASDILANIRSMLRHDHQQRLRLDVNDVVRDVFELVRGELERHRIVVDVECACDIPTIVGELVPLQQVVLNLVMNAVEEMASLTARPRRLFVETKATGSDGVLLTVTDNGCGIEPSALERIFDAFFTTKAHGMGMGLSICRSIVEAHGGRLWAAPAIPHGSTFNVLLPLHDDATAATEEPLKGRS